MRYTPRFEQDQISSLAERYCKENSDQGRENIIEGEISRRTHQEGFYNKADFLEVCRWKSPRTRPRCEENDEEYVREVTGIGLSTQNEQLRIEALTLLRGVSWPTASVLLHFGHRDPYPILDFRALSSLSIPMPREYNFRFWWEYVEICREISRQSEAGMRTLDRALWQFSKENDKESRESTASN
ncbi:MAG: hypothetical protein ABSC48_12205 [Terracidiphilus sp.]|jgi:hypothetical protein